VSGSFWRLTCPLLQLANSSYVQRQARVLAKDHLSHRQINFAEEIGACLSSGSYVIARLPNVAKYSLVRDGLYAVGRRDQSLLTEAIEELLREASGGGGIESYARAWVNGEILMGTAYTRAAKRNNRVFAHRIAGGARPFAEARSFHVVRPGPDQEGELFVVARPFTLRQEQLAAPGHGISAELLAPLNQSIHPVQPLG
jgi:hypothetical protein